MKTLDKEQLEAVIEVFGTSISTDCFKESLKEKGLIKEDKKDVNINSFTYVDGILTINGEIYIKKKING